MEITINSRLSQHKTATIPALSRIAPIAYWSVFITLLGYVAFTYPDLPAYETSIFQFNGFTALIWLTVLFFSAIVANYSKNYLKGTFFQRAFSLNAFCFSASVLLLVASNSIFLVIASWISMGYFMSQLIGINTKWNEAREARRFTFQQFAMGSGFLAAGLLSMSFYLDDFTLNGMLLKITELPERMLYISAGLVILAALVQSAVFPFHKWLLSAMTAPTPASAMMHAGFVNGSGILLVLFAPLVFYSNTYDMLFVIGGITAIVAQFTKLLQVQVKHKLACSTIAQMGFMIMQCGLGFFNAAIAHLILHGFYKAYLFLSSGEEIKNSYPTISQKIRIKPFQAIIVLITSVLGAYIFMLLTGKGWNLDSGIFLTLIVAITVGQATYNIVKQKSYGYIKGTIASIAVFVVGISLYALMYNWVSVMMKDLPMVNTPLSLSFIEILFGGLFLVGFFFMKLGWYKRQPWLYVKLLNASQPAPQTLLNHNS
ncbi:proton-conducting transporter transmembrane domain-containing protein [Nonlabens agnitus]|uniref:Pesticidal protein Cry28Aa n=1 Tax=Nonlabens agnitus TaxID=870484 RepID=A0A2S9WXJ7_9FLAO|nr:proton-conducting transporter membrane subunit [Nonlabens agnitus]PRP68197.1 pesticidal protein Cry28Aa [Nonlabens agnitus]